MRILVDLRHLRMAAGIALLVLAMQCVHAPGAMAAKLVPDKPAAVIAHFHATLLSVMHRADELGYRGRYAELEPKIRAAYDLPLVARLAIGRAWRSWSADRRVQFVRVFSRLVIATYASRFDGYAGETFNNESERQLHHNQVVIHSRLSRRDDDDVQLDYILHQSHGSWRIINVIADGASDLALKRADYASVLKHQGFHALISSLKEKIAQYQ